MLFTPKLAKSSNATKGADTKRKQSARKALHAKLLVLVRAFVLHRSCFEPGWYGDRNVPLLCTAIALTECQKLVLIVDSSSSSVTRCSQMHFISQALHFLVSLTWVYKGTPMAHGWMQIWQQSLIDILLCNQLTVSEL